MEKEPFEILSSSNWSDDAWHLDQAKRTFHKNSGTLILQSGSAEVEIVGGNITIFTNLKRTEYFSVAKRQNRFLEDDAISAPACFDEFDRMLQGLSFHPAIRGLVIGRFPSVAKIAEEHLRE